MIHGREFDHPREAAMSRTVPVVCSECGKQLLHDLAYDRTVDPPTKTSRLHCACGFELVEHFERAEVEAMIAGRVEMIGYIWRPV